jgi:hypothetical protein
MIRIECQEGNYIGITTVIRKTYISRVTTGIGMAEAAPMGTIGHALRTKRRDIGDPPQRWTATEMSRVTGVEISQGNYNRWELGISEPNGEHLDAIVRWLGIGEIQAGRMVVATKLAKAGLPLDRAKTWQSKRAAQKSPPRSPAPPSEVP